METKTNHFFSGPQDISAMKVAEILTYPCTAARTAVMIRKGGLEQMTLPGVSQLGLPPDSWSLLSQDWRSKQGRPHWHENQVLKGLQLLSPIQVQNVKPDQSKC